MLRFMGSQRVGHDSAIELRFNVNIVWETYNRKKPGIHTFRGRETI